MEELRAALYGFFGTLSGWLVLIVLGSVLQKIGFWGWVKNIITLKWLGR